MFTTVVTALEYQKLKSAHDSLQQKVDQMETNFLQKFQEKENEIFLVKRANERIQMKMDEALEKISSLSQLLEVQMMDYYEQPQTVDNCEFIAEIDENAPQNHIHRTMEQTLVGGNHRLLFSEQISEHATVEEKRMKTSKRKETEEKVKEEQLGQMESEVNGGEEEGEEQTEEYAVEIEENIGQGEEEEEEEEGRDKAAGDAIGRALRRNETYANHSKLNGKCKQWFQCAHCPETFRWLSMLIRHERTHTGEKPFKCDKCGKEFARVSTLNIHQRIHTGEKPYKCHLCVSRFTQLGQLQTHILRHTGERPFKCIYCGQKFSRAANLRTHLRRHTNEKPFMCSHCGKQFAQSNNLQIHLLTHSRKHKCEVCPRSFTKEMQLKNHVINAHQQRAKL